MVAGRSKRQIVSSVSETENGAWTRVNTADDISNVAEVNKRRNIQEKEKHFLFRIQVSIR